VRLIRQSDISIGADCVVPLGHLHCCCCCRRRLVAVEAIITIIDIIIIVAG
jgi:hypothetical protein